MPRRVLAFLLAALAPACAFDVRLGPADGVDPIRYEDSLDPEAFAAGGSVETTRDVVIITAESSGGYLDRFGDQKIAAIRGVELTLVESRVAGGEFTEPPRVSVGGEVLVAPGDTIELSDYYVNELRARILERAEVLLPITVTLTTAEPVPDLDAWAASVEIVVVIQPTLHVNAGL